MIVNMIVYIIWVYEWLLVVTSGHQWLDLFNNICIMANGEI